jgi:diguanylate cyclase (GGDEF)-like protein
VADRRFKQVWRKATRDEGQRPAKRGAPADDQRSGAGAEGTPAREKPAPGSGQADPSKEHGPVEPVSPKAHQRSQRKLVEALHVARTESEANELLRRHLERTIPGSSVVVLHRSDDGTRLQPVTRVPRGTVLVDKLSDAEPEACVAVRVGRTYERSPGASPELLSCELCDVTGVRSTCRPMKVAGDLIGSVLVLHGRELEPQEHDHIDFSIAQAGATLGKLGALRAARSQASSDEVTGLASELAVRTAIERMVAEAGRRMSSLAFILAEIDQAAQIKELHGPRKHDQTLAAAADVLRRELRASDLAGRQADNRFVALLPDTGQDGAMILAEKLRKALTGLRIPGVDRQLTASLGVAVFPNDGGDAGGVRAAAERALATASSGGRNRVWLASAKPSPRTDAGPGGPLPGPSGPAAN